MLHLFEGNVSLFGEEGWSKGVSGFDSTFGWAWGSVQSLDVAVDGNAEVVMSEYILSRPHRFLQSVRLCNNLGRWMLAQNRRCR
ncbi:hypothetical protein QT995_17040 [Microcoleus sp. S36b_A3]|uniref:hypothetical protein n=1 Tax=unclassified Microcoleus TaxID=2642155 RepID=UPI002FCE6E1C